MPIPLSISKDINGLVTTGSETCRAFSDLTQSIILTANTIHTFVVPQNPNPTFGGKKMMARFTFAIATGNPVVWVLPAASPTLTLPTTSAAAAGNAELNPGPREVVAGQSIQMLTAETGINVCISYYVIQ